MIKNNSKYIFLWVSMGLILGIVAYDCLPFLAATFGFLAVVVLLLIWSLTEWTNRNLAISFTVFFFFCLGIQLMDRKSPLEYRFGMDVKYAEGDVYSAKVLSVSRSQKTWNKAVMEITGIQEYDMLDAVKEKVLFMVRHEVDDLKAGDYIFCNTPISDIVNKNNPGEFDSQRFWQAKGIHQMGFLYPNDFRVVRNEKNRFERWFDDMDAGLSDLFENKLKPEAVGVAKAIILGDRDHLDSEAIRSFGNAGAMHVLAVSGLHVGLILAMLIYFFSLFPKWISRYKATIISLLIIWVYAILTGFSPSVFRAVVMFSMLTVAKLSGRDYQPLNILAASAFVLLMYSPRLVYDLGFQLSYCAMLGILIVYPYLSKMIYFKNKWVRYVWEGTSIALAAQLFTLPLTLYCFHQFPNYFLLSNIGLMVFTNLILICGVLFIVLQNLPGVNIALAWTLSVLVLGMFYFVQWIDELPGSVAKGFDLQPWHLMLLYAVLLTSIFIATLKWKQKMWATGLLAMLVCLGIVSIRMKAKIGNEFVVFNENHLTLTLKYQDVIYCFYENKEYIGRSKYLCETYEKTKDCSIKYVPLNNDKITRLKGPNLDFSCQFKGDHYDIQLNDKNMKVVKFLSAKKKFSETDTLIYMPWVHKEGTKSHFLAEGAYVAKL